MASLLLPNVTFVIPVCYIGSPTSISPSQIRPYHALTPVQSVPTTPVAASIPSQPQHEPTPIMKASG